MKMEGTGLEGKEIELNELDLIMQELGFVRWAWDYKRATYDYKYRDRHSGETFFLRVPSQAIEGVIEDHGNALLRLGQPYMARHLYPHGFDYEYDFPKHILDHAKSKLESLNQQLQPAT